MGKLINIIMALTFSSVAVCGEVYTWIDANGVKRFSNTPVTSKSDNKKTKSIGHEINYTGLASDYESSITVESIEPKQGISSYEIEHQGLSQLIAKPVTETQQYNIEWSTPKVSGDNLSIHGNVSDDASCPKLNVMVFLYDEKGNEKFIRCHAAKAEGSGSRMLDGNIKLKSSDYGSDWRVSSHSAKCSR
jgi:hypothetical protein